LSYTRIRIPLKNSAGSMIRSLLHKFSLCHKMDNEVSLKKKSSFLSLPNYVSVHGVAYELDRWREVQHTTHSSESLKHSFKIPDTEYE
jgi:hypothetical protein